MSYAALSESRAAALESSAPSNAMKPAASKTWRSRRADVRSSRPAEAMKSPDARKTWGRRRADVNSCSPAKPMQTTTPNKTLRGWRADMGNSDAGATEISGPAEAMKTTAAGKAGRDRRADMGNSGAVKLMKIAAVEATAGETGGDSRGARRFMNTGRAKAMQTWIASESRSASIQTDRWDGARASMRPWRAGIKRRLGMCNDDTVAMMAPSDWRNDDGGAGAPIKTAVPLIAARIIARAVPAIIVPATAVILHRLYGR
jgi:hypothetical protein